jgi:hypothetical protein
MERCLERKLERWHAIGIGRKASLRLDFSGIGGERLRFRILQNDYFLSSETFARSGLKIFGNLDIR